MTPSNFDELAKGMAKKTSRRDMLRILGMGAVGAAVAAVGLNTPEAMAAPSGQLGEQCKPNATEGSRFFCDQSKNLACEQVTGAYRCECAQGFNQCADGTCQESCGGTPQTCSGSLPNMCNTTRLCHAACSAGLWNGETCQCACPSGQSVCTTSSGTQTCATTCTGNQVQNGTCTGCVCPAGTETCPTGAADACYNLCPTGQTRQADCTCACNGTVCNGVCITAEQQAGCEACGNKVFNAQCCSCENPGQVSGKCKGEICTSAGCTCAHARRTDTF